MKFSELMGALSHALDLTEGQPRGHCIRVCWIGTHVGKKIGLGVPALRELYYTLLLKDLGCSSNAARICELYLTDDLKFKRDFKTVGEGLPDVLQFVFGHTGLKAGLAGRLRSVARILRNGAQIADELIKTRCTRGADIARQLRFGDGVAMGIGSLDEHWNGHGRPQGLAGQAIPLYARIALLAQIVDVFHTLGGRAAALRELNNRAGSSTTTTWTTLPPRSGRSSTARVLSPAATARAWRTSSRPSRRSSGSRRNAVAGSSAGRCCTTWASSA
jgi:hypothetical protein